MPSKHAAKASAGRDQIEQAILALLREHKDGLINNEIARELGLESDFAGRQRNYLTYSVLGGLMKRGLVKRDKVGNRQPFKIVG
jgi:predicted DNA-binding transcriptional regulator